MVSYVITNVELNGHLAPKIIKIAAKSNFGDVV